MTRAGASVEVPLGDLGPVEYDPTTNSLRFSMKDTGQVIDGLKATAKELNDDWAPSVNGESLRKS